MRPMAQREYSARKTMDSESFNFQLSRKCLPNALKNAVSVGLLEQCLQAVGCAHGLTVYSLPWPLPTNPCVVTAPPRASRCLCVCMQVFADHCGGRRETLAGGHMPEIQGGGRWAGPQHVAGWSRERTAFLVNMMYSCCPDMHCSRDGMSVTQLNCMEVCTTHTQTLVERATVEYCCYLLSSVGAKAQTLAHILALTPPLLVCVVLCASHASATADLVRERRLHQD